MSTSLKGPFGMLIAGLALSLASFLGAMLPSVAEAQDTGGASTQEAQQNNTDSTDDAPASSRRPAGEAPTSLMVEPGDSLWSIGQERLGAGATPGRIAQEVERLFALNRGRIGDDPNLLFAGQELRLAAPSADAPAARQPAAPEQAGPEPAAEPSGAEPATAEVQPVPGSTAAAPAVVPEEEPSSSVVEPAADAKEQEEEAAEVAEPTATAPEQQPVEQQFADEQPVNEQPVDEEPAEGRPVAAGPDAEQAGEPSTLPDASPASADQEDAPAAGAPRAPDNAQARRRLGLGILALTFLLAILAAWRLPMRRDVEDPDHNGSPNGANGRGKARGPGVPASAEPVPYPGDPQGQIFANKPYVDRTVMVAAADIGRREVSRRRALAETRLSRKKGRPTEARDPAVRLFLRGMLRNGARKGALPGNGGRR